MNKSIIKRTIRNIRRSGWRAYAMVFMMTITYVMLGSLLSVFYGLDEIVNFFEERPEVMGFFKEEVTEEQILEVKRELEGMDFVKEVAYTSKEQAMDSFVNNNVDNQEILESITVNVFPAHLNVKATNLNKIPDVANVFRRNELIEEVLAAEDVLEQLNRLVFGIQAFGFALLFVFVTSTIFIIFLAIGVTIYSHKDEIRIMKLVGATNNYVRAPYLMQSLFYSLLSALIAIVVLVPVLFTQYRPAMAYLLRGMNVSDLRLDVILVIGVSVIVFSVILSLFSSYFATRRYIND